MSSYTNILPHVDLLSVQQFGFRRFHSTSTALLIALMSGNMLIWIVVYIIFPLKQAFDTVNHDILLAKLELYGIKNTPLMLFQ